MNSISPNEFIPQELDDAIYSSILTTPEKWKVTYRTYRSKVIFTLSSTMASIEIEESNAYWDWDTKIYWGYSVSDRIMKLIITKINEYRALKALKEEQEDKQRLRYLISTI
jgi:hypothetical protein